MTNSKSRVFQIKITLIDSDPEIWRRILIPQNNTFWDLHVAIQEAMGWEDIHLHEFLLTEQGYTINAGLPQLDGMDYGTPVENGWEMSITDYFKRQGQQVEYVYDFGDQWQHQIVLEGIVPKQNSAGYPICLDGHGACPPENCGGVWGYEDLHKILADPTHEDHEHMKSWFEDTAMKDWPFDRTHFDTEAVIFSDPKERLKSMLEFRF